MIKVSYDLLFTENASHRSQKLSSEIIKLDPFLFKETGMRAHSKIESSLKVFSIYIFP